MEGNLLPNTLSKKNFSSNLKKTNADLKKQKNLLNETRSKRKESFSVIDERAAGIAELARASSRMPRPTGIA